MDIQTIDQQYQMVQNQNQQVVVALQQLASQMQTAAQGGDNNARGWLLDLKQVALTIQGQQQQTALLLQAIHNMWQTQQTQYAPPPYANNAPMGYAQPQSGGIMGALDGFLNSGFGRAMEMGAGIGLGEDLINKIF